MDSVERAAAIVALADQKLTCADPGDTPQHLPRILSVGDVFAYRDPSYLIEPVIPEGTLVLLDAFTGTGKSLVSLELALSITDGFPFLGRFRVNRTGPVLLFDEETPEPYLKDRLRRMGFSEISPLSIVHFSGLKLDDDRGFEAIRRAVDHVQPVVTIFDSLIRFHTANEDSAQEMSLVMERLRAIVNMGTTVWAQHHLNKGEGDLRKRSRGSSDIPGAVDLELALIPHDDLLTLQSVKSRAAPVPPCELKIIAEEERLHVVYQAETEGKTAAEGAVRELLSTRALSVGEIEAELLRDGIDTSRRSIQRILAGFDGDLSISLAARGKKIYTLGDPPGAQVRTTCAESLRTSGQPRTPPAQQPPSLGGCAGEQVRSEGGEENRAGGQDGCAPGDSFEDDLPFPEGET